MTDTSVEDLAARLATLSPQNRRLLQERLLVTSATDAGAAPTRVPRDGRPLPASFFQERLWLVDQLVPGSSAYVVWFALQIRGDLHVDVLTRALDVLIGRHEALRTALEWTDGQLVQVVRDAVPVPLDVLDVRRSDAPQAEAQRLLQAQAGNGFDLARAPMLRVWLVRTGDRDHMLGLFLHHAVTDGWSNGVLMRELGTVYRALLADQVPDLPPLRVQYADAAVWQRRRLTDGRLEELLGYWDRQLRGAPELLSLPVDQPRRAGAARGGSHSFTVPAGSAAKLRDLARQEKATSFMLVLAGLAATLARWSGQSDVVVGSPQSNRTHPDLDNVVGPMVDLVVLRLDVHGETSARELVRRARRVALDAHAHSELPFERLVERLRPRRSASYHPVIQVNLGVQDFPRGGLTLPRATVEPAPVSDARAAKFDLSVYLTTGAGEWSGTIKYNAELFSAATVARLADGLTAALSGLAEDPDRPVGALPLAALETATPPGSATPLAGREAATAAGPAAVTPRDRWERDLAQAWSHVLGVDRVGATDDFFALGGHSMSGMLAVERIHQITGRRIGLATLFAHPTVEALATVLRGMDTSAEAPFVVRLQPHGSRPPLFFTPPAIGELAVYFRLARELGNDRPLYGVQPDGFFRHGDPGDLTLTQLARRYASEMVLAYPAGPYHLCGFSTAGRLAVAVADQLARLGRPVGAVVLLDSAPYGDVAADPDLAAVLVRWLPFAPPAEELSGLDRDKQIAITLASGRRGGDLPPTLGLAEFRRWCRKLELGARALAGHGPLGYPGAVTLLVRSGRTDRDIAGEWDGLPVGAMHVHEVDVEAHMSFVEGSGVPVVARTLDTRLSTADLEWIDGTGR